MEDTINTIKNETEENTEAMPQASPSGSQSPVEGNPPAALSHRLRVNAIARAMEMQEQINHYLKQLSLERLQVVADFVAYLADKESEEATQELLKIPGFVESFEKGKKDISEGRIKPLEQLKRKY
jgi:hypothetical protein